MKRKDLPPDNGYWPPFQLPQPKEAVLEAAAAIRGGLPTPDEMAFMHAVLAQIGLPRSKVEGRRFERTSGGVSLVVQAGEIWDGKHGVWVPQPIPYGSKPRIMLADICTRALRTGSRVVDMGDSVTEYVRQLGWTSQGGPRGVLTMFQRQVKAFAVCDLALGLTYGEQSTQFQGPPVEGFDTWLDSLGKQRTLWPAQIRLSESFWTSLQAHAVPLDMRAIQGLHGSALALDLYAWLAYRLHRLKEPLPLSWKHLRQQFGQEYKHLSDFKAEVLRLLPSVLEVYDAADIAPAEDGLELRPSRPPISRKVVAVPAQRVKATARPRGRS